MNWDESFNYCVSRRVDICFRYRIGKALGRRSLQKMNVQAPALDLLGQALEIII